MRLTAMAIGFACIATAGLAAERQVRIEVSGLFCPSCSYIAGEALQKAESVELLDYAVAGDGATAVYTLVYDDTQTNPDEIAAQPVAYGYGARVLDGEADG